MVKPPPEFTAEEIVAIRKRLGLTQEKFAEEVGVRREAVARWESKVRRPSLYFRLKLAELKKGA